MRSLTFTIEGDIDTIITVTELDDGTLQFEVTQSGDTLGDYRALFFDVADETVLDSLVASGDDVTDYAFNGDSVDNLGQGANIKGEIVKDLGKFDAGIEFGTAGMSTDDIQTTTFILSSTEQYLTLEFIEQQNFAIRITSVGEDGTARNDSLKLAGLSGEAEGEVIVITGDDSEEEITGDVGDEVIDGGGGNDTIDAGDGDDKIVWTTGDGDDTIQGGDGFDEVRVTLADDTTGQIDVSAVDGNVIISGDGANAFSLTIDGVEDLTFVGGPDGSNITIGDLSTTDIAEDTIFFFADPLLGGEAVDVLDGSASSTRIEAHGFGGDDTLIGGDFDDLFEGGQGDDTIDGGGEGFIGDIVFYDAAPSAVTIDLRNAIQITSEGTDTLIDIEGVAGSAYDDHLIGNAENNILAGLDGNDILDGGDGIDRVGYLLASDGVTVDLNIVGPQDTVGAGTDTLISIENVLGSEHDDSLTGDANNNFLTGRGGDDFLDGGDDLLIGGDAAGYAEALVGVTVDLRIAGAQDTVGSGTDTLVNIENLIGSAFDDVLTGDDGGNFLRGDDGDDILDGQGGFDTVGYDRATDGVTVDLNTQGFSQTTGQGEDTLIGIEGVSGSDFDDVLTGNGAGNFFRGSGGDDIIDGGGGFDSAAYTFASAGVTVSLETIWDGVAQDTGGDGTDTLTSIENLFGSDFDDVLTGDENNNVIRGNGGDDIIDGGAGIRDAAGYEEASAGVTVSLETIWDGVAQDTGADGTDTLSGIENLFGSAFDDVLTGDEQNNFIRGNGGDDIIDGGDGFDGAAYDQASAGVTVDLSVAEGVAQNTVGDGWDTLSNMENLFGSAHDDTLTGDDGNNLIRGGAGNDIIDGGDDLLIGGDAASYDRASAGVTVDLSIAEGVQQDTVGDGMDTLSNMENLIGSNFGDVLTGDSDNNFIRGNGGNDTINGGAGHDTLVGDFGNDTLIGGIGNDTLTGGGGNDLFVFDDNEGADRINGFNAGLGVGDVIDLSAHSTLNDFAAVIAAADDTSGDTVIDLGGVNSLTLTGVLIGDLAADDFDFLI